ncbi:MAG: plastocyanin/azurin family copper-binding protein [Thermoproteota archaeon]|nr:plastocyanin/azurin family copper-binding protein [Thermoproteota archaeon]
MERVSKPQMAGIGLLSFIVIVAVSLSYYQFTYLPALNAKPEVAANVLNPPETTQIAIEEGSAQPTATLTYSPKEINAPLGVSNKVVWTNEDVTAHTVTTDNNYEDPINGRFDSLATIGLIPPQGTYEFTFTQEGEYPYHCEPHPWMTAKVDISRDFG